MLLCWLTTFWVGTIFDIFLFWDFLTPEDGTVMLSQNVGKELPLNAA